MWNLFFVCFFVVWYVDMLQYNPLALNHFLCSSRKRFGCQQGGFDSGLFSAFSFGMQTSHFSSLPLIRPILSFSFIHPSVIPISRLPFPLNKWRNAGAYFLNLVQGQVPTKQRCDWQGSVLEWLRGSLFAAESRCWQPRLGLQCRPGKPKNKNNTCRTFSLEWVVLLRTWRFFLPLISVSAVHLPDYLFCVCLYFPSLIFYLAWTGVRFLVAERIPQHQSQRANGDMMSHTQFPRSIPKLFSMVYLCRQKPKIRSLYYTPGQSAQ